MKKPQTILLHLWHVIAMTSAITTSYTYPDVVETESGQVRGVEVTENYNLGDAKVSSVVRKYLGIPYAAPPVGALRFKPPQSPLPWQDVRDATEHGWVCPQITFHPATNEIFQNEDCLFLDIYVPHVEDQPLASYPVMVFIHGGSFEVGAGKLYDGTVLAQLGVVIVTINYRLGALGFLASGTEELKGNLGIMDQIQALRYVQQNIEHFHGDPNQVTIFGHSAGGASVGLLMVLSEADGLFHGVIAQSGSAVASYCVHDDEIDFRSYVKEVGDLYSCSHPGISDLLDCLREVPYYSFIEKRLEFPRYDPIDPEFRPYIDGTLVKDYPDLLFQGGHFYKVPVMVGTVRNEFGNYFNGGARHRSVFDDALDHYVSHYVRYRDVMELVKHDYTHWDNPEREEYDRGAVLSDMHMVAPTVHMAQTISQQSQDVYQYHFDFENSYHSKELNYVFGSPFSGRAADEMSAIYTPDFSEADRDFSVYVMTLWTNFAKHGNPTPIDSPDSPQWPPVTPYHLRYLSLSPRDIVVKENLRQEKVHFWNSIIPRLRMRWPEMSFFPTTGISSLCSVENYRVNLWVFLSIVSVLFILVLLLVILFIKTQMENSRMKKRCPADGDKKPTMV